ncbi:hypothetical protein CEXT_514151 [Caerostris extrusa]|uniref:Ribosomal protein S14 n=1 Tax=Caerostris extrusa TaxID=172846 RepID=A0AAV4N6Q2_CAEEX|nr:hypothetical protein CEXT_514151 [Caerostris extrusa]
MPKSRYPFYRKRLQFIKLRNPRLTNVCTTKYFNFIQRLNFARVGKLPLIPRIPCCKTSGLSFTDALVRDPVPTLFKQLRIVVPFIYCMGKSFW